MLVSFAVKDDMQMGKISDEDTPIFTLSASGSLGGGGGTIRVGSHPLGSPKRVELKSH